MSNLVTLIKYNILNSFPIISKLNKKKNHSTKALVGLAVLAFLAIFAFITIYMCMIEGLFAQSGHSDLILLMGITMSSLMIFFTNLTQANAYLFRTKDYDLLMSLPVRQRDIVLSKFIGLYFVNFLSVFSIMGGTYLAYVIFSGFDLVMLLLYLVTMIFLPVIPVAISSLVAFGLGYFPLNPKTKNFVSTILYILFFIVFSFFYSKVMNSSESELLNQIAKMKTIFKQAYPMAGIIFEGFYNKDLLSLVIFIGSSLVISIIFVIIVSKNFKNFNNYTNRYKMSKDFKITNEINKSNGEIKTLLLKEIREYVSIRSYVINTIVGPILSLVFTITLSKQMLNGLEGLLPEGTLNVSLESFVFGFIVMISTFFLFLTNTSASSISLEGKNFWIIKSAPVKTSSVFMSKILLNMMIVGPFAVANVVISAVLTKANLIYAILALLMMLCIVGYFSTLGLYVNILLPKFDYDSPVKVIKQSMSALIVTGMAFVISIILISCYTVFGNMISPIVGIIICFAISLALLITSIILLKTHGKKKYEALCA